MTSARQVRAQYTQEFKLEAVRQGKAGKAIAVVGKVLGIPKASLSNWVRLAAKTKRKFVVTTDSKHSLPVAPELVQRHFNPPQPNQLWCGDITYIQTDEGWRYLAAVLNLFSRRVLGWSLQPHMQTGLVKDTLAMAWWRRRPPAGLIFHSDRGSQYCSH